MRRHTSIKYFYHRDFLEISAHYVIGPYLCFAEVLGKWIILNPSEISLRELIKRLVPPAPDLPLPSASFFVNFRKPFLAAGWNLFNLLHHSARMPCILYRRAAQRTALTRLHRNNPQFYHVRLRVRERWHYNSAFPDCWYKNFIS